MSKELRARVVSIFHMTYNSQTIDYSTVVESFAWFFRLSKKQLGDEINP